MVAGQRGGDGFVGANGSIWRISGDHYWGMQGASLFGLYLPMEQSEIAVSKAYQSVTIQPRITDILKGFSNFASLRKSWFTFWAGHFHPPCLTLSTLIQISLTFKRESRAISDPALSPSASQLSVCLIVLVYESTDLQPGSSIMGWKNIM